MGEFLNQYVTDLRVIIPLAAGATMVLVIFSVLYNRWMSDLGDRKDGYVALFVALGNFMTLLIVAIFSWKAALLVGIAFIASGTAMIVGDIVRSLRRREEAVAEAKKASRRKPLPYFAGRLINDAYDELIVAENKIGQVINDRKNENIPQIAVSISKALRFLFEAKSTEGE